MWHLRTVISDTSLYFAIKSLSCLCVCGKMCQGEAGVTANIIIIITRVLHLIWNLFKRMATASGCLTVSVHHHRNHHLWLPKRIFYLLFPFFCPTSHWWTGPICLSFSPFIISSLVNSVVLHFLFFFHLCLSLTHPRFKGWFFFYSPLLFLPFHPSASHFCLCSRFLASSSTSCPSACAALSLQCGLIW